mmetsp:Transcript_6033/g.9853  ORF Transcript_6033/g.9853 Transcript_6033/m.9853 type:complete len:280 (+) Transcript_6033:257-1096(+)|eukprot:scaffold7962_cov139-Skeletonema_menzelii.AAC.7
MKQAKSIAMFKKAKPKRTAESHQPPSTEARTSLSNLIATKNWYAVSLALSSTSDEEIEIDANGAINQDNILHFALRFHAPLHVVDLLCNRYPQCVNKPDNTGKLCTHVAAKYSALPDVMAFIISKNPAAAGCPDNHGKCPIHYVAEFYSKHCIRYEDRYVTTEDFMLQVVRLLKQAAPQSFNLEDEDERNPIEIAIDNDVGIRVIKMMQRTARDDWREMKQSGQGVKHEVLAKNLERSAKEARVSLLSNDRRNTVIQRIPRVDEGGNSSLKRSFTAKSA